MTYDSANSLILDACLATFRVTALLKNVPDNRRLVDILNSQDTLIEVFSPQIRRNGRATNDQFASLAIRKQDLIYAVPRETSEQVRLRQLSRSGIVPTSGQRAPITVFTRVGTIAGTVTLPSGMTANRLELAMLPRFFAVAEASVTDADGVMQEEQVVVLNRDQVIALTRPAS